MKAPNVIRTLFKSKFRRAVLVAFDMLCLAMANLLYYLLAGQVSFSTPVNNGEIYLGNALCLFVCIFALRFAMRVYSNVWRYTNTFAYVRLSLADFFGCVLSVLVSRFVLSALFPGFFIGIWHAVTVSMFTLLLALFSRFSSSAASSSCSWERAMARSSRILSGTPRFT